MMWLWFVENADHKFIFHSQIVLFRLRGWFRHSHIAIFTCKIIQFNNHKCQNNWHSKRKRSIYSTKCLCLWEYFKCCLITTRTKEWKGDVHLNAKLKSFTKHHQQHLSFFLFFFHLFYATKQYTVSKTETKTEL